MIDIKQLTKEDIKRRVVYRSSPTSKPEEGYITSYNDTVIFVDYSSQVRGQATPPSKLSFIMKEDNLDWSEVIRLAQQIHSDNHKDYEPIIFEAVLEVLKKDRPPEVKSKINWDPVINLCVEYRDYVNSEEYHEDGDDYRTYIYETSLQAVFGKYFFEWFNKRIECL